MMTWRTARGSRTRLLTSHVDPCGSRAAVAGNSVAIGIASGNTRSGGLGAPETSTSAAGGCNSSRAMRSLFSQMLTGQIKRIATCSDSTAGNPPGFLLTWQHEKERRRTSSAGMVTLLPVFVMCLASPMAKAKTKDAGVSELNSPEGSANIMDMDGKKILTQAPAAEVKSNSHTARWRVFTDVGRNMFAQGRLEEAEKYFRKALDESKQGFGEDDPHVASSCNNLAEIYRVRRDYLRAEPLYLEAVARLEAAMGKDNQSVGLALHNLGGFYLLTKNLQKSKESYEANIRRTTWVERCAPEDYTAWEAVVTAECMIGDESMLMWHLAEVALHCAVGGTEATTGHQMHTQLNWSDTDEGGVDDVRLTRSRSLRVPHVFQTLQPGDERRLRAENRARALAAARETALAASQALAAANAAAREQAAAARAATMANGAASAASSFGTQLGMPVGPTGTSGAVSSGQSTSQMAGSQLSPLTPRGRELLELQQVERIRERLERELKNRTARLDTLEADKAALEGLDESAMTNQIKVLKNNVLSLHAHVDSRLDFMQNSLDQILDLLQTRGFRPAAQSSLPLTAMSGPFPVQAGTQPSGHSVSMDFMDTLVTNRNGKRHIFVIIDRFTKYARLIAMPETARTEHVIKLFLDNWVRDFGLPKSIVSDRDVRFTSELWKKTAEQTGNQLQMTSGNHPEANGQAEQMNRVVQHLLRHYIKPSQDDWDEKLPLIASLYNNAVHSSTGVSPNQLHLGWKPRSALDFLLPENRSSATPGTLEYGVQYEKLLQQAVEHMKKSQQAMIASENKHRRQSSFQVKEASFGKKHPEYALTLFHLGEVIRLMGNVKEAEKLIRESLSLLEESGGGYSPAAIRRMSRLAELLVQSRQLHEAELVHRRILHIVELSKGSEGVEAANAMENLSGVLRLREKLDEAAELLQRCLQIRQTVLCSNHMQVGSTLFKLGIVTKEQGDAITMKNSKSPDELEKAKDLYDYSVMLLNRAISIAEQNWDQALTALKAAEAAAKSAAEKEGSVKMAIPTLIPHRL
ncbi:hypothetical protein CBR_g12189 [Chara braunii]|uniref:Integrase catalytic domain-containing protein n=1 Tax=Chara braunii TaxID=69332 RepID=A0A388KRF1_CHABU|nr:hypothetical protein CBR_g12189 [Chara braunii]|eukprot:GBG72616.1 hypothetical protein CBR_g12189 [Chara braunii]